ncbi:hypothetical protein LINGRAHAP2_LOCUS10326 [Linum grandiflorum]
MQHNCHTWSSSCCCWSGSPCQRWIGGWSRPSCCLSSQKQTSWGFFVFNFQL